MKRAALVLLLVLPAPVTAQDSSLVERPRSSTTADAGIPESGLLLPSPNPSQQNAAQAKPVQTVRTPRRPRPEGSMVGYVEDAMVGSRVRFRFDSAFDNPFPDRAEFFYAKCGCYQGLAGIIPAAFDPDASGPGPGVPETVNFQQLYLNAEYAKCPFLVSRRAPGAVASTTRFQAHTALSRVLKPVGHRRHQSRSQSRFGCRRGARLLPFG